MLILRNIRKDPKTGNYIAIEAGSKFEIAAGLYSNLYEFIKINPTSLIGDWYRLLPMEDKIEVKQSSIFDKNLN